MVRGCSPLRARAHLATNDHHERQLPNTRSKKASILFYVSAGLCVKHKGPNSHINTRRYSACRSPSAPLDGRRHANLRASAMTWNCTCRQSDNHNPRLEEISFNAPLLMLMCRKDRWGRTISTMLAGAVGRRKNATKKIF